MKKTKQPRAADSAQSLEKSELIRAHLDACVDVDEERMRSESSTPRTDAIQTAFNERDGMQVGDIIEAYKHARELETLNAQLLAALRGVVRVADRKTVEFDAARAAIAAATRGSR